MNILLTCLHQQILQIEQRLFWSVHVDESSGNTSLPATTGTAYLMYVVLDLLGHGEDNDVLNIVKVETF